MSPSASQSSGPLDTLLAHWMDDQLSDAEWLELRELLTNDSAALDRYLDCVRLHALLEVELGWQGAILNHGIKLFEDVDPSAKARSLSDAMILPAIRIAEESEASDEVEDLPPATPATTAQSTPALVRVPPRVWLKSIPGWRAAAALLIAVGGLVAIFAVVHHRSAATLVASVDAKWDQGHANGDAFAVGTTSRLISGFAEFHFAGGATVIAEGPAEIVMRSEREIFVSSGKIFASVPGGGFVVSTPAGTVTDLGTEFGVSVSGDQCEVAVFKGKVQVDAKAPSQNGASAGSVASSTVVVAGQAVSVSSTAISSAPASAISQHFTRTLQVSAEALDLVDLVAGGDGTTHLRGPGIDASGNWGALPPIHGVGSDGLYHKVPGLAVVDGVSIPKGGVPTQLNSAGDSFVFPGTLGESYNQIWTAGKVPVVPGGAEVPRIIHGIDYSSAGHGLLYLHPSRGLTFDLDAIRKLHPNQRVSAFRCLIANAYAGPDEVKAEAWVFTGRQLRFSARDFSNLNHPVPVSIAIGDNDRFLTIVTGYPLQITHSWLVVADPVLELEAR